MAFKDQHNKAHLSFISQCGHRELDRGQEAFYPSLRVVWFPSQLVSIENPLYLECRSSYWLGGKGYSLPDLQVLQHEIIQSYCRILVYKAHHVLLGPSIPGKLSAIFCELKIESRSPLMDTALSKQLSACSLATSAFLRKPEREISVYSFIITTIMHWDYLGFLFFFSPPLPSPFQLGGEGGVCYKKVKHITLQLSAVSILFFCNSSLWLNFQISLGTVAQPITFNDFMHHLLLALLTGLPSSLQPVIFSSKCLTSTSISFLLRDAFFSREVWRGKMMADNPETNYLIPKDFFLSALLMEGNSSLPLYLFLIIKQPPPPKLQLVLDPNPCSTHESV